MTTLPAIFEAELGSATRQVISDVEMTVKTVRDVRLVSIARVYPTLADLDAAPWLTGVGVLLVGGGLTAATACVRFRLRRAAPSSPQAALRRRRRVAAP